MPRLLESICECGQRDCQDHVQLTLEKYEAIRCDSRRSAVVPGHVWPEIERVVAGTARYEVVEKTGKPNRSLTPGISVPPTLAACARPRMSHGRAGATWG